MPTDLKPTTQQQERAKYADPLWELHNSINRLVAACAYELTARKTGQTCGRELCERCVRIVEGIEVCRVHGEQKL